VRENGLLTDKLCVRVVQGLISAADQSDGFSSDSYSYLKNGLWWAGMLTSKSLISTLLHSLWGTEKPSRRNGFS